MTRQVATFGVLLLMSWVVMLTTHELGHIVGGWLGGAVLLDYELMPWRLPHSLHSPDPHPRLTLWAGPLLGVLVPTLLAFAIRHPYARFIANFCLLANGTYLALAWLSNDRLLDTPRMLAAGTSPALILLFCAVTIPLGYIRFRNDCIRVLGRDPSAPKANEATGSRPPPDQTHS